MLSRRRSKIGIVSYSCLAKCLKFENAGRHFQPGEGPSRGLLRDCENFASGSFAALQTVSAICYEQTAVGHI